MPSALRRSLRALRAGEPGRRFQEHYQRRQQSGRSALRRWSFIGGGVVVMAAGVFFLPAPGPGFLILFVGAGLVAQESRHAARALDALEMWLRAAGAAAQRVWRSSSVAARVLIVVLGLAALGGAAYLVYTLLFAR